MNRPAEYVRAPLVAGRWCFAKFLEGWKRKQSTVYRNPLYQYLILGHDPSAIFSDNSVDTGMKLIWVKWIIGRQNWYFGNTGVQKKFEKVRIFLFCSFDGMRCTRFAGNSCWCINTYTNLLCHLTAIEYKFHTGNVWNQRLEPCAAFWPLPGDAYQKPVFIEMLIVGEWI